VLWTHLQTWPSEKRIADTAANANGNGNSNGRESAAVSSPASTLHEFYHIQSHFTLRADVDLVQCANRLHEKSGLAPQLIACHAVRIVQRVYVTVTIESLLYLCTPV
jgi:hypothetical protein